MSSLAQSDSVKYYMGWYGDCTQDPFSETGSCEPFDLSNEPKIKLVWEVSEGIKAFSDENPSFSPIQQLEAGKCYMVALHPGDGKAEIPHFVPSGDGGYVGKACPVTNFFVTVEAYSKPYTTPVVDNGFGYYPVQYKPGQTVTLTAKTREGHSFEGWTEFSPSSIWGDVEDATSETISFTMPAEDVTVKLDYLHFTRDTDNDGVPDYQDDYPNQQPQSINWNDTNLTLLSVGDEVLLGATASSQVTYEVADTSIAVVGTDNVLRVIADGTTEVTATAEATETRLPAYSTISLTTDPDSDNDGIPDSQDPTFTNSQVITFDEIPNQEYKNDPASVQSYALNATSTSGLPISYASSNTDIAVIGVGEIIILGSGDVIITASQEGNAEYHPADPVARELKIALAEPDRDFDTYPNEEDYDPDNPWVFTGDADGDGIDTTIDPDDNDPDVGIIVGSETDFVRPFADYSYGWGDGISWNNNKSAIQSGTCNLQRRYSEYYRAWSGRAFPVATQGEKYAGILTTNNFEYTVSDCYHIKEQNYSSSSSSHNSTSAVELQTFWRQESDRSLWYNRFFYGTNIMNIPFFNKDGTIFAAPFEWMGYYPLYATKEEAITHGDGGWEEYEFSWDAGINRPLGDVTQAGNVDNTLSRTATPENCQSSYLPNGAEISLSRKYYMPKGLQRAVEGTPPKDFRNFYWKPDDGEFSILNLGFGQEPQVLQVGLRHLDYQVKQNSIGQVNIIPPELLSLTTPI